MINLSAIRDMSANDIIWNRIEKNAKLVKQPRGDFYKAQFDANLEVLREEIHGRGY